MECRNCGAEYEDGVTVCVDCDRPLDADETVVLVHLGTFTPVLGDRVLELLRHRWIEAEAVPADADADAGPDALHVAVDEEYVEDLLAELFTAWPNLVAGLEPEDARAVRATGGSHPGWFDAPRDVFVDRYGRVQAASVPEHDEEARVIGPALVGSGGALVLLAVLLDLPLAVAGTIGGVLVGVGVFFPR